MDNSELEARVAELESQVAALREILVDRYMMAPAGAISPWTMPGSTMPWMTTTGTALPPSWIYTNGTNYIPPAITWTTG